MAWTDAEQQQFALLLLAMGELYETPVSAERAELFARLVEDLPFEAVQAALNEHGHTSKFFPKPADLRELALGNTEDQAEQAWTYVLKEIRRVGYTGRPTWPDAVTERAALGLFGGGWRTLCENLPGSGPELLGYRKQFVASYGAASRQVQLGELPPSRSEAKAALSELKEALKARRLPTGDL